MKKNKYNLDLLRNRKSTLISALIDIFILFFGFIYLNKIENNIELIYSYVILFAWVLISYITGRYYVISYQNKLFLKLLSEDFYRILLTIILNFFLTLIFISIPYITNEIIDIKKFINVIIVSVVVQFFYHYLLKIKCDKYRGKWIFIGSKENYFLIKEKLTTQKKLLELNLQSASDENSIKTLNSNFEGIVIDNPKININFLNTHNLNIIETSEWFERVLHKIPSEYYLSKNINFKRNKFFTLEKLIKRLGDLFVSSLILILSIPLLIIISLIIKLEDGGPVFYSQVRTGKNGKLFRITKLRTMYLNAEKNGAQWAQANDKRITKIGKIIRIFRIDELPQLISVIKGEMSLIGPRPERPEIDKVLKKEISSYEQRLLVKPGLSGWAQVNYPYGASISDAKEKLSYDLFYIKNFSILLDFLIFIKTIKVVFTGNGAIPN